MTRPSVSITGATGFVGWPLAEAFRDAGWSVTGIVRPRSLRSVPRGTRRIESPLESDALAKAIAGSAVLVHAAGVVRAPRASVYESINVGGTRAAIDAANSAGTRLVYVSSLAAAGKGTIDRPCREDDEPRPLTAYGRSKLAAENLVRSEARSPWTIVRPPAVYGPRDRAFLPLFRLAARGVFLLLAEATRGFTLIHVDDLAQGIVRAASTESAAGNTFFLGHPQPRTTDEVLRGLASAVGRPYRPYRIPRIFLHSAAWLGEVAWLVRQQPLLDRDRLRELEAGGFVCAVDRIRDALGFSASIDWPEGAVETARWYREHGWI